jgi:hypothetical protein
MDEPATTYINLDEKELRSIISRRAQNVGLAARNNAHSDKLHDLQRDLLIAILNLGDLEKKKKGPELPKVLSPIGGLIDDEVPF